MTRGVDIGAKEEIYKIVLALAAQGAATLYYSTDMEELLRLCHRVAVFHDGYVSRVVERDELTDTALVSAAFGHARAMSGSYAFSGTGGDRWPRPRRAAPR